MMIPKVLVLSGSDRSGSLNKKLARAAARTLALMEAEVTMIALADYPLPLLGANTDRTDNAGKLARMFAAHDALFLASPEYNASVPPLLKNAIDWVSLAGTQGRAAVEPYDGLTVALGSASDEAQGGIRVLDHLRTVFVHLGAQVVSEQCVVADARNAFGEDEMPRGDRKDSLEKTCRSLLERCTQGRGR